MSTRSMSAEVALVPFTVLIVSEDGRVAMLFCTAKRLVINVVSDPLSMNAIAFTTPLGVSIPTGVTPSRTCFPAD
ncbi:unnamed protein product [Echinostoma caproni]|uniref:Flavin reductase n=1 Tax=Echinostoma caproni TaxID=27848 RepID=A0A183BBG5_9TREM|nr:unnamed protein product [Echinostoma caproni]